MGNMQINEDGSVTIPIKGREPLRLEEPSMWELAEMHKFVAEADAELGLLDPLPDDAPEEDKAIRRKENLARTNQAFSHESPHGAAMVKIINMLCSPEPPLTERELPGWLCHPSASNTLIVHFRTPLPGLESGDETSSPSPEPE